MATTVRAAAVAAISAVLVARQTASPTLLRRVHTSRPGSFPEIPCAYIGSRDEQITHTSGLRTRTFPGLTVVLVDALPDPVQTADRMDVLVDLLVDDFTAAYAFYSGGGILQLQGVSDTDVVETGTSGPDTIYRGCILTFGPTFATEGRT